MALRLAARDVDVSGVCRYAVERYLEWRLSSLKRDVSLACFSLTHIYAHIPGNPWEDLSAPDGPTFYDPGAPSPPLGDVLGAEMGVSKTEVRCGENVVTSAPVTHSEPSP
ncbi:hypothetical protein Bbelb_153590 [Branchiostoma belcheri]|nr:hypothetical protein Bbelb_153590 [Branchiostoma belcheri]